MGRSIRIVSKGVVVEGKLNDSKTASEIEKLIPLAGRARTWGGRDLLSHPFGSRDRK